MGCGMGEITLLKIGNKTFENQFWPPSLTPHDCQKLSSPLQLWLPPSLRGWAFTCRLGHYVTTVTVERGPYLLLEVAALLLWTVSNKGSQKI